MNPAELKPVFYDVLDTVRTTVGGWQRLAEAHLIFGFLRRELPVLSTIQGLDSKVVLNAVEDEDFRSLVENSFLQFRLHSDYRNLTHAFEDALDDHDFLFSGWPELNSSKPNWKELRGAVKARLLGTTTTDLPCETEEKVAAFKILATTEAQGRRGYKKRAQPQGPNTLARRIGKVATRAKAIPNALKQVLLDLADRRLRKRSYCYAFLEQKRSCEDGFDGPYHEQYAEAKAIVDMCYNDVLAASLVGKGTRRLTSPTTAAALAVAAIQTSIYPKAGTLECAEVDSTKLLSAVEPVGWHEIFDYLTKAGPSSVYQFLARCEIDNKWHFAIRPKLSGTLGAIRGLKNGATIAAAAALTNDAYLWAFGLLVGAHGAREGYRTSSEKEREALIEMRERRNRQEYFGLFTN